MEEQEVLLYRHIDHKVMAVKGKEYVTLLFLVEYFYYFNFWNTEIK